MNFLFVARFPNSKKREHGKAKLQALAESSACRFEEIRLYNVAGTSANLERFLRTATTQESVLAEVDKQPKIVSWFVGVMRGWLSNRGFFNGEKSQFAKLTNAEEGKTIFQIVPLFTMGDEGEELSEEAI